MARPTVHRALTLIIAMVLAASCAAAPPESAASPGGESPAKQTADDLLASAIYSALNADPIYYFRHVNVQVHDGVAHLSGYVWSTDAIYRARAIAAHTKGVTRVVSNQLELERNGRGTGGVAR
jgi:osmotically-inducible protein OsmY